MAKTLGLLWRLGKTRRKLGTGEFKETKVRLGGVRSSKCPRLGNNVNFEQGDLLTEKNAQF